jgi:hypothetical protein
MPKFSSLHVLTLLQGVSVKARSASSPLLRISVDMKPYQEFPPEMFEPPVMLGMQKISTKFPFTQEPGVGLPLLGTFARPARL